MFASKEVRETLEIDKIVRAIASEARSELGIELLTTQEPFKDMEQLSKRHLLIDSFRQYQSTYGDLPWANGLQSVYSMLEFGLDGGLLSGEELLNFKILLTLATRIKGVLNEVVEDFPELGQISRRIRDFSGVLTELDVIDQSGRLYDGASPRLRDLRDKISDLRKKIRKAGNDIINSSASRMLQERVLSLRNGRFVMLIRQEFVGRFQGILIDRSSSGNSVYMEPNSIVPLNNRLASLRQEELEEERRILRKLTSSLVDRSGAVMEAQEALGLTDMLYATSHYMDRFKWIIPEMVQKCDFKFYGIKHPLLGKDAIPIDIYCGSTFRILVITGPNTGGKTVALKTAAVGVYLAWSGLPVPAIEGSYVGDISSIYTDIGDEQSIEQSLSTFSSHLKNVITMLKNADEKSLVLLDELGAGTDPQEGAALGVALLKTFKDKRSLVLATTHHNPIKKYATTTGGVETASVDFDLEKLTPTYHLVMGIPGQSNALAIAKRLGMPDYVIDEAKSVLTGGEASVETMINELQRKSLTLEALEEKLIREKSSIESQKQEVESEKIKIEKRKRQVLLKADKEAERIIEEADKETKKMLKGLHDAAKSAAHRELTTRKKSLSKAKERSKVRMKTLEALEEKERDKSIFKEGDVVQISGSGTAGEILSISEKKATVQMGSMRIDVPLSKLISSNKKIRPEMSGSSISVQKPVGVPSSIMVRGMTIDEAMPLVRSYLDRALLAGYGEVSVIHGKGEGILRKKVHELCRKLKYVDSFRLGGEGEGGYGVTIVRFK